MSDNKNIKNDYDYSRDTYYELLEKGKISLELMIEVARESEHPRAFEVLSGMMKNMADINDKLMDLNKKGGGGSFEFATSNALWRATLDILDFMPLATANYSGGLIITDWYSETNASESIKITIKFLSNEIRADGLDIDIRKKNCDQYNKCIIKKIESDLNNQIKDKILKKAAIYQKNLKERRKKNSVEKKYPGSNE